jgi:phosphoglycerate dehydrogenase-like enzyme
MKLFCHQCAAPLLAALAFTAASGVHAQLPAPKAATQLIAELGLLEGDRPAREHAGWRAPKTILLTSGAPAAADLQASAPDVSFIAVNDPAASGTDLGDIDAIIGGCSPELLARAPRVRWLQSMTAGVDQCVGASVVTERGLLLTNMQRVEAAEIAEHGIALALALARNLETYVANQARGDWNRRSGPMRTLRGKTMLVVGLGGVGTEVARRGHALAMKVTATRATGRTGPEFVSYVGLPDELLTLAKDADLIINTSPLTPATTQLFDARFFAVLKPSAYFVNIGRGRSVVTEALVAALKEQRLAGAALDVVEPEPLPPGHPLWRTPNVIITPHAASSADPTGATKLVIVRENLRRYVAGERMLSVVQLERGY